MKIGLTRTPSCCLSHMYLWHHQFVMSQITRIRPSCSDVNERRSERENIIAGETASCVCYCGPLGWQLEVPETSSEEKNTSTVHWWAAARLREEVTLVQKLFFYCQKWTEKQNLRSCSQQKRPEPIRPFISGLAFSQNFTNQDLGFSFLKILTLISELYFPQISDF